MLILNLFPFSLCVLILLYFVYDLTRKIKLLFYTKILKYKKKWLKVLKIL